MGTYTRDIHRLIAAQAATRASERRRRPWRLLGSAFGGFWHRFAAIPSGEKAAIGLALILIAVLVPIALAVLR